MGQSVSIAALSAGSAGINVRELEDLTYEKTLSSARFMKCVRARHQHGLVVVKVAMRPPPDFKLTQYAQAIRRERDLLADVPNALGYQRIVETENCGYLVRQYLHSSLYDRMSTRPFLDDIEKKWLAYQLLSAIRDCHARNVYHGDIKTENILVTSWNWLYLTDFSSSFKKTYLPEDNPADFSYFFDISGRRTCYLAPERFLGAGEEDDGRGVTWAMDIFSVGCVIAELFTESPIFSLSQLFKYRKGEHDPSLSHLARIHDKDVRELVTHMIQVEPESRYSAEEYLNFWRRKAFPEYFYSFLHQYMGFITDPSSGRVPVLPDTANFGEADDRIDRVYYDFDKIAYFLGYEGAKSPGSINDKPVEDVLPVQIDIPNNRHVASSKRQLSIDDGTLIFLTLIVSALRNTARATSRIRACDLMLAFGERITDEAKLDRILPYLVVLFNDKSDAVTIAAIRSMAQLLALVDVVSPVNAYVFTEYIRPRLHNLVEGSPNTPKATVRATYASCLASLAHTSLRILDMVQALRADGSMPTIDPEAEHGSATDMAYRNLYDVARYDLIDHFEMHTKALLTDSNSSVRRAFLGSISSLCVFFGSPKANDVVLSHLNTYLNDQDWMLKCAFFQTVVGVATYVGSSSLEDFILPLMLQALTDPEEFVVEKVLLAFANMAELGLLQRSKSWEMVDIIARFMVHPNIWIREAAAHFVTATTTYLSLADNRCIILPLIRPYLKIDIVEFSETVILDTLQRPLPRPILEMAAAWSQKAERGLFWKSVHTQRTFSFGPSDQTIQTISSKDLHKNVLHRIAKNDEDEQWLTRLRNLGMSPEDEVKLFSLRDYIHRVAFRRAKDESAGDPSPLNNIMKLQNLNITPQTVFFESHQTPSNNGRRYGQDDSQINGIPAKHTLTDALLDASTTLNDPLAIRKRSIANNRKGRVNEQTGSPIIGGLVTDSKGAASDLPSPVSSSPGTRKSSFDHALLSQYTAKLRSRGQASSNTNTEIRSDGSSTPTESMKGQRVLMRHSPSAMNLLNRKDQQKAVAETSTDATNAMGEMDGPLTQESVDDAISSTNIQKKRSTMADPNLQAGHTYEGGDPSVTRLLNMLASENYQVDELDLGPLVTPINRRTKKSDVIEPDVPWRPLGIHVATFSEHTASINRVLPSPDHMFFITASDDGNVKVWDTLRLERNLIHKSRQTHKHSPGSQVKCIAFVENTHSFISCANDGSVTVVKVDCVPSVDSIKYGKLNLKRSFTFSADEYAVWCEHFRAEGRSTLIMATNASRIVALDLRTMSPLYTLTSPLNYGMPTTFCIDRKRNWLLLGTSRGILSLYDLRFRLAIKAWGLSGGTPIRRLVLHPSRGRGRWVCVAGGTAYPDISVWDIEKMQCRDAFRTSSSSDTLDPANLKDLARAYQPVTLSDAKLLATPTSVSCDNPIRAVVVGSDTGPDERESKYGFLISGGTDRKVRFWDLLRVEGSATVSGLATDEPQPKFATGHPNPGLVVNLEKASSRAEDGSSKDRDRSKSKVSRAVAIAREQKSLLRGHLDDITDVAVLEGSTGMIVSVDRKGCIYVSQ